MANDAFIDIAAGGIGGRSEFLHEPKPRFTNIKKCKLKEKAADPIPTDKKMDTKEEMQAEVLKLRKQYEPFLKNYVPKQELLRKKTKLTDFVLNGTEQVTLPHYGGPVGYAKHTYECDFTVDAIGENETVYICFNGVDYKSAVLVNGEYAGSHEGFFSPFEFNITNLVHEGVNKLKVTVENDHVYGGHNGANGERFEGDKLYAATGIGWDDAALGWHHCPAGLGIYADVFIETRANIHIHDLFVRPIPAENRVEAWIEVELTKHMKKDLAFRLSLYGQNIEETVFEKQVFTTETTYMAGMGDSLTQAQVKDIMGKAMAVPAQWGTNVYKLNVPFENAKIWDLETPYLYQLQVEVLDGEMVTDRGAVTFGMREFIQDTENSPKGMFYLNGKKTRLRGANTMGFEQLDVMRGDFDQLIDDILLAKVCNMNFWRITQRPVQDEVYQYCDMLGFMVQTDLPLFGCMRRNKVAEGIRQAEEMERLIRKHPCCILASYINEPFPNAKNEPHRHLERPDLEKFFESCDYIVRLNNPDRVIKHVDGDYDPPTEGMPDNHCYPTWYNGHGIDIGKLHKGYWLQVKPGWYYGCGEFGTEGLECSEVMKKYYPKEWLVEPFDPGNIVYAQTKGMHRFFYDTQDDMESWIEKSQHYQALGTKLMMESFRRDTRMISNAIHLFIDAWPSGWMKTIMDCDRNPKQAYFAYKNALEPIMISLRTDRFTYFCGETASIEAFICNDTNLCGKNFKLCYELYRGDEMIMSGDTKAEIENCEVTAISDIRFTVPKVSDREELTLKAILLDEAGAVLAHNSVIVEAFEDKGLNKNDKVVWVTDLASGEHTIAGEKIFVKDCGMLPLHFVSRKTGHEAVSKFRERDFSYWYNKEEDMITPLIERTFTAEGFTPILLSGNQNDEGEWDTVYAAAAKEYDGKLYVVCTVDLRMENPIAKRFVNDVYQYAEKVIK